MGEELSRLSVGRKAAGLLAAAAVAWLLTVLTDLGWPMLLARVAAAFFGYDGSVFSLGQLATGVTLYAIVGLPLALIVCLALGFPAWMLAERRGLAGWASAVKVGAGVGFLVGAVVLALALWSGVSTALDDSSSYSSWSWGGQVIEDGMPTLLGWAFWLADLIVTVGVGCAAGAAAWWAATRRSWQTRAAA